MTMATRTDHQIGSEVRERTFQPTKFKIDGVKLVSVTYPASRYSR